MNVIKPIFSYTALEMNHFNQTKTGKSIKETSYVHLNISAIDEYAISHSKKCNHELYL
jgi:hypothetical protein